MPSVRPHKYLHDTCPGDKSPTDDDPRAPVQQGRGDGRGWPARLVRRCAWFCLLLAALVSVVAGARQALSERVPHCVADDTRHLLAVIKAIDRPTDETTSARARLKVEIIDDEAPRCTDLTGRRLRLNWHLPPPLRLGETWRLAAEVRPPWAYQSPGGFDYERWLMANRLNGTGYVREGQRLAAAVPTLREALHAGIAARVAPLRNRNHLLALATGNGSWLTDDDWALLRRTGTVHLLVVSGLHVGLVAVIGLGLGFGIARLVPWLLPWLPAGWLAAGIALGAVGAFAWLAGGGVPAVRAAVMSTFGVLALMAGRRVSSWRWLALAAVAVICLDPLAVLANGFWLSFGAVALLVGAVVHRYPSYGWLAGLFRAQWILLLGMTPLVAAVAGEAAPAAGPANLFAVPWVSMLVVPLVLLSLLASLFFPWLAGLCWAGADAALSSLLGYLGWLDTRGAYLMPIGAVQAAVCLFALACLLCAAGRRVVLVCLPLFSVGFTVPENRPPYGEVRVLALDVGQGSAVLIDTQRHRLLYDTGARFASGFDLGEAVVLPAIAATGRQALDGLIVSHGDIDHAGGAPAVLDRLAVRSLLADVPGLGGRPCRRGQHWTWDGVRFSVLHPPQGYAASGNDSSCVLSVVARGGSLLLPGDIELAAERLLLAQGVQPVDLVFMPHHGSNTSSSRRFVEALEPRLAIAMAGLNNRYGHPHPLVAERYAAVGARLWVTGRDGTLTWQSMRPDRIRALRQQRRSAWWWWINEPPGR